jgi:hypothetical protein
MDVCFDITIRDSKPHSNVPKQSIACPFQSFRWLMIILTPPHNLRLIRLRIEAECVTERVVVLWKAAGGFCGGSLVARSGAVGRTK